MTYQTTNNHGLALIDEGTEEDAWGPIVNNEIVTPLEESVPVLGTDPTTANAYAGGLYIDTSTGEVHTGNGSTWDYLGDIRDIDAALSGYATESWVSSNYNNYTDSQAVSAVESQSSLALSGDTVATETTFQNRVGDRRYQVLGLGDSEQYHKICNLKDPTEGTNGGGAVKATINFADNRGSTPITTTELHVFAKGDAFTAEFSRNGPINSNPFDFVITEEDTGGAGDPADFQYYLYVKTETWVAIGVDIVPGEWFGTHDFIQSQHSLAADLPGSVVYDTATQTPDRTIRVGDIESNGELVATQTWANSNFNNYTDSQAVSAVEGASAITLQDGASVSGSLGIGSLEFDDAFGSGSTWKMRESGGTGKLQWYQTGGSYALEITAGLNVEVPSGQLSEQGNRVATRTWTTNNFNNYTFSESYNDLTDVPTTFTPASHGNEAHSEAFIGEGDGVSRDIYVSADGTIPAAAGADDIVLTEVQ